MLFVRVDSMVQNFRVAVQIVIAAREYQAPRAQAVLRRS